MRVNGWRKENTMPYKTNSSRRYKSYVEIACLTGKLDRIRSPDRKASRYDTHKSLSLDQTAAPSSSRVATRNATRSITIYFASLAISILKDDRSCICVQDRNARASGTHENVNRSHDRRKTIRRLNT